jgi:hypothetical protein
MKQIKSQYPLVLSTRKSMQIQTKKISSIQEENRKDTVTNTRYQLPKLSNRINMHTSMMRQE